MVVAMPHQDRKVRSLAVMGWVLRGSGVGGGRRGGGEGQRQGGGIVRLPWAFTSKHMRQDARGDCIECCCMGVGWCRAEGWAAWHKMLLQAAADTAGALVAVQAGSAATQPPSAVARETDLLRAITAGLLCAASPKKDLGSTRIGTLRGSCSSAPGV
jgi:hypothetical protein